MARITKADNAPKDAEQVTLGAITYDLPFESDDPTVLSNARANPFLLVEGDEVAPVDQPEEERDPNDPHDNPAADHLSALASPEAVAAAEANAEAIHAVVQPQVDEANGQKPTIAEGLAQTFANVGIADVEPHVPSAAVAQREAPTASAPPTPPSTSYRTTDDQDGDE